MYRPPPHSPQAPSGALTHEPYEISFGPGADGLDRLRTILGHCDLRVYLTERGYIDVGRGSFTAIRRAAYFEPEAEGCLGRIGQFCNFAQDSMLFAGGEHWNEKPVNVVFTATPMLGRVAQGVETLRPKPGDPFVVGDAVVASGGARVLGGARVGTGAVLAAGCLAAGELPAFSLCAGIPAKPLRPRVDEATRAALEQVRWWDFDIAYLANHMPRLQEAAVDASATHEYRRPAPRFALRMRFQGDQLQLEILGFTEGDDLRPIAEAPAKARAYVEQVTSSGPFHWLADPWL